jgi:hypothetical protein
MTNGEIAMADDKLSELLKVNKNLDFVKRILEPDKYPVMPISDTEYSTHQMSYGDIGGKYFAYPEIVYDRNGDTLRKLNGREAMNYALDNKEAIFFPNKAEAEWFTQNYKNNWSEDNYKKMIQKLDSIRKK